MLVSAKEMLNKAREGKDWSGGIHGISKAFFTIIQNVIKIFGVVTVLAVSAPWLLLIIGVLLIISTLINAKKNKIEVKYFSDLANINRVLWYVTHEIEDFRFGKDAYKTDSIQAWIDAKAAEGGGRVTVPPGTWDVGKIHLRSNVELHLSEECVLPPPTTWSR